MTHIIFVDETQDKIIVESSMIYTGIERGYCCDLKLYYTTFDIETSEKTANGYSETIKDVVLMQINKKYGLDNTPIRQYVFYK